MSYYTSKEKRLKDAAQAVLDDPNATFDQLDKAKRRIDQLAAKAAKRTKTSKPQPSEQNEPDPDGWQPTPAQRHYLDQLLEDGKPEEAEVWRLVYKMEADDLKCRQAEGAL